MIKTEAVALDMIDQYYKKYYIEKRVKKEAEKRDMPLFEVRQLLQNDKSGFYAFKKKNYKYFLLAAENFSGRQEFTNGKDFINAIMADRDVFPQQLAHEYNWEVFLRNKNIFSTVYVKKPLVIADNISKFFVFLNGRKIEDILNNSLLNMRFIEDYDNDNLDMSVLAFSKSFKSFAEKEKMLIDFKEEQSRITKYPIIVEKLKEKLVDDFFMEE